MMLKNKFIPFTDLSSKKNEFVRADLIACIEECHDEEDGDYSILYLAVGNDLKRWYVADKYEDVIRKFNLVCDTE